MRMKRLSISILLVSLLLSVSAKVQGQTCRAANDSSYDMIEMVKQYAVVSSDTSDEKRRIALGIPSVTSASQVVLVKKAATCKAANTAYQSVATGARQTLTGMVFVVQVGSSYVVWDPGYRFNPASPADIYMVFNSSWVKQSIF